MDRLRSGAPATGLLFNPLSGRIRKRKDAIRRALTEIPGAVCREVTNAQEINASVDAFMDAGIDLLVIVGGDGTVQGVLCHLFATQPLAKWPMLTVVPGGTTNMTALDLGICGSPESILQQLRDYLLQQTPPLLLEQNKTIGYHWRNLFSYHHRWIYYRLNFRTAARSMGTGSVIDYRQGYRVAPRHLRVSLRKYPRSIAVRHASLLGRGAGTVACDVCPSAAKTPLTLIVSITLGSRRPPQGKRRLSQL